MARLISAKCPECGARLEVEQGAPTARCSFCNTLSRVEGSRWSLFPGGGENAGELDDLPVIRLRDPMRWVWAVERGAAPPGPGIEEAGSRTKTDVLG